MENKNPPTAKPNKGVRFYNPGDRFMEPIIYSLPGMGDIHCVARWAVEAEAQSFFQVPTELRLLQDGTRLNVDFPTTVLQRFADRGITMVDEEWEETEDEERNERLPFAKDDAAAKKVADAARDLDKKLTAVEEELYQIKNQSSQDPLNFPIKLNNRLAALLGVVQGTDAGPTKQSNMVYEGLASEANAQLRAADKLLKEDVGTLIKLVRDSNIPAVTVTHKEN